MNNDYKDLAVRMFNDNGTYIIHTQTISTINNKISDISVRYFNDKIKPNIPGVMVDMRIYNFDSNDNATKFQRRVNSVHKLAYHTGNGCSYFNKPVDMKIYDYLYTHDNNNNTDMIFKWVCRHAVIDHNSRQYYIIEYKPNYYKFGICNDICTRYKSLNELNEQFGVHIEQDERYSYAGLIFNNGRLCARMHDNVFNYDFEYDLKLKTHVYIDDRAPLREACAAYILQPYQIERVNEIYHNNGNNRQLSEHYYVDNPLIIEHIDRLFNSI